MAAFSMRTIVDVPSAVAPCMPVARRGSLHQRSCPALGLRPRLLSPVCEHGELHPARLNINTASAASPCEKISCPLEACNVVLPCQTLARKVRGLNDVVSDPAAGLLIFLSGRSPTTVSVSVHDVLCIIFILTPGSLRSLCSHGQQHYSVACPSASQAVPTFDRTRPQQVEPLQGNGSIMCRLVTMAHFEREEASRVKLTLHEGP